MKWSILVIAIYLLNNLALATVLDENDVQKSLQTTNFSLIVNTQPRITGFSSSLIGFAALTFISGDPLNITCRIAGLKDPSAVEITHYWNTPEPTKGVIHITKIHGGDGQLLFLSIPRLYPAHSGEYVCGAHVGETTRIKKLSLIVRPPRYAKAFQRSSCTGDRWFRCNSDECISSTFVCDGVAHCTDESDEAEKTCGEDPCEGKVRCDDGRCFSMSVCCESRIDVNCTAFDQTVCCSNTFRTEIEKAIVVQQNQENVTDVEVLNSATYMVLGCMVAFVFVATTLIIAVVRVQTKRSITFVPPMRRPDRRRFDDFDFDECRYQDTLILAMNRRRLEEQMCNTRYMRVMFNVNNGVQFVSRPGAPPPYSECSVPAPVNEPPPPYISVENLAVTTPAEITEIPELQPLFPSCQSGEEQGSPNVRGKNNAES